MSDQCVACRHNGSRKDCEESDCSIHESWFAKCLLKENKWLHGVVGIYAPRYIDPSVAVDIEKEAEGGSD